MPLPAVNTDRPTIYSGANLCRAPGRQEGKPRRRHVPATATDRQFMGSLWKRSLSRAAVSGLTKVEISPPSLPISFTKREEMNC